MGKDRDKIADIIEPFLWYPLFKEDDEKYQHKKALELADKIIEGTITKPKRNINRSCGPTRIHMPGRY